MGWMGGAEDRSLWRGGVLAGVVGGLVGSVVLKVLIVGYPTRADRVWQDGVGSGWTRAPGG